MENESQEKKKSSSRVFLGGLLLGILFSILTVCQLDAKRNIALCLYGLRHSKKENAFQVRILKLAQIFYIFFVKKINFLKIVYIY